MSINRNSFSFVPGNRVVCRYRRPSMLQWWVSPIKVGVVEELTDSNPDWNEKEYCRQTGHIRVRFSDQVDYINPGDLWHTELESDHYIQSRAEAFELLVEKHFTRFADEGFGFELPRQVMVVSKTIDLAIPATLLPNGEILLNSPVGSIEVEKLEQLLEAVVFYSFKNEDYECWGFGLEVYSLGKYLGSLDMQIVDLLSPAIGRLTNSPISPMLQHNGDAEREAAISAATSAIEAFLASEEPSFSLPFPRFVYIVSKANPSDRLWAQIDFGGEISLDQPVSKLQADELNWLSSASVIVENRMGDEWEPFFTDEQTLGDFRLEITNPDSFNLGRLVNCNLFNPGAVSDVQPEWPRPVTLKSSINPYFCLWATINMNGTVELFNQQVKDLSIAEVDWLRKGATVHVNNLLNAVWEDGFEHDKYLGKFFIDLGRMNSTCIGKVLSSYFSADTDVLNFEDQDIDQMLDSFGKTSSVAPLVA